MTTEAKATTAAIDPATLLRGPRRGGGDDALPRVFFTADLHLNHENILREDYCPERGRLFGDLARMNDGLTDRWNARARDGDIVIVVGDFTMGLPDCIPDLLGRLRGEIWLVEGNHDRRPKSRRAMLQGLVHRYIEGDLLLEAPGLGRIIVSHHPLPAGTEGLGLPHGASLQLCGHVHEAWARRGMAVNVGVDVRGFEPRTLSEILAEEGLAG